MDFSSYAADTEIILGASPLVAALFARVAIGERIGRATLLAMLAAWGSCGGPCPEDIDGSGDVGLPDLLAMLAAWGPCP